MGQEQILVIGSPRLDGSPVDAGLLASLPPAELARLEGRFAWARREAGGGVRLGRDGSGLVPLYFDPSTAQAATRIEDLRGNGQARRLDRRGLATYVAASHMPAPLTIWEGVARCPAGAMVEVGPGGTVSRAAGTRWPRTRREAAALLVARGVGRSDLDALAAGRTLTSGEERGLERWAAGFIVEELRRELRGHDQILLSGGLDSTILSFLAHGTAGTPIRTFTFGAQPQDPWSDGPARARPVAARLGSRHEEIVIGPDDYVAALPDYLGALSEPALSSYLPYLISRHLRGTGRWVFGMGADETFFGDPWYGKFVRAYRAAGHLRFVPRLLRAALAAALRPLAPRVGGLPKKLALLAEHRPDFRFLYAFARDNLDIQERLDLLAPGARPEAYGRDDANFSRGDPFAEGLEAVQEMLLVHEFPDGHGLDLSQFHEELDLALPFLSPGVVAGALAVRPDVRAIPGKWFLREAVRGIVPEDLLRVSKGSFVMPAVTWLREPLRGLLQETLAPERLARRGIWNVAEVRRRLDQFEGGRGSPFDVIRVLFLELWMDRHRIGAVA